MSLSSYKLFPDIGVALDPIHVGTGGARVGGVDLSIVRDPATRLPKIPGSSLAGVHRTYVAMAKDRYPRCAGLGQASNRSEGHCGQPDCPVCTVFGFARGQGGGFVGLAAFSDAHVLLFPVHTREGPLWITSPGALRMTGLQVNSVTEDAVYRESDANRLLNIGWLMLPVKTCSDFAKLRDKFKTWNLPHYVTEHVGILPDWLFTHAINSNLEVRTSVSIDPTTGTAEDGALFTYEALPRTTFLYWELVCKNPQHFRINNQDVTAVRDPDGVQSVVKDAYPYLEHLGIGGMATRGMGRLKVVYPESRAT